MRTEKQLLEERARLWHQMKDLHSNAASDGQEWSEDRQKQWDKMDSDIAAIEKEIERVQRLKEVETIENRKKEQVIEKKADVVDDPVKREDEYRSAFGEYMRLGKRDLTSEKRSVLEKRGTSTQVTGTAGLGGYLVPELWSNFTLKLMKEYGGMLQVSRILPSVNGDTWHLPKLDVTAQVGGIRTEATAPAVSDMTYTEFTLSSYIYTSYIIKVSAELLNDAAYPVEEDVFGTIASRIGRILNQHFTTGTGTGQPNGVVTATSAGKTAAANTAITRGEILDLIHSVDPAYRGQARLMFSDPILAAIKKLSLGAGDSRPLWVPSMREGAPDTIEGYPYTINQDMATFGSDNIVMLFGDFSKYFIRQVQGLNLRRTTERYWDENLVGYEGIGRWDADLADSTAIKHLLLPT